jgi:hypothetical protein
LPSLQQIGNHVDARPAGAAGRNCKVAKTTDSNRSVQKRSRVWAWLLPARWGWFRVIIIGLLFTLGGLAWGYLFGRDLANRPLANATQLIRQLQPENQRLKTHIAALNTTIASLQAKLRNVQAVLDALSPAENTYTISPNQSVIVADGRLTIGLIGSPTNQNVAVNINGKRHTAASGDVFDIASDPSTTCQVRVQSFDMFKATVTALCTAAKPGQSQ